MPDLEAKDSLGLTPLTLSVRYGDAEMTKTLLEHGANVESTLEDGSTPLFFAALEGQLSAVRLLLGYNSDVNVRTNYGETALIVAAFEGYLGIVRLLIDAGADINAVNEEGFTALLAAASNGYLEVVNYLTSQGAKSEIVQVQNNLIASENLFGSSREEVDFQDDTIEMKVSEPFYELISAAIEGRLSVVNQLLAKGAQVNKTDDVGLSLIHI